MDAALIQPGDCLLYRSKGFFGGIIALKTWHKIGHVEVYDGDGFSWASRDGKGVNRYPWRASELAYVLRPTQSLVLAGGRAYGQHMTGTPYGWLDLLAFVGVKKDRKGIVCSPFAVGFYRACGWRLFPTDDINAVAPFEFLNLVGNGFEVVYPPA